VGGIESAKGKILRGLIGEYAKKGEGSYVIVAWLTGKLEEKIRYVAECELRIPEKRMQI